MSEFETVLQECLHDLEQGAADIQECLQRHPKYAAQLEPVLLTSAYLARGRETRFSPAFKARVRNRLLQQMDARPRRMARASFGFMRLAIGLAVVMLALLAAGTAYAQRALPGEAFYTWKLASETAWRMVSPDPVATDLAIADRRLNELIAVKDDPALYAQALNAYLQVADRLRAQADAANDPRILGVLDSQADTLTQLGILPEGSEPMIVPPFEAPIATPILPPLPVLETPQVNPTELPQIVPTAEVGPEILPTIQDPPKILPTIEIPPPIP
jgi:hypothetical protein